MFLKTLNNTSLPDISRKGALCQNLVFKPPLFQVKD